jgi:hypothetical protein
MGPERRLASCILAWAGFSARMATRHRLNDIEAKCQNITALWLGVGFETHIERASLRTMSMMDAASRKAFADATVASKSFARRLLHVGQANTARSQPILHPSDQSGNEAHGGYAVLGWSGSTWRLLLGLDNLLESHRS